MRVQLSAKGLKTAEAIAEMTAVMDEGMFRGLSAEERTAFQALVAKVIQDQALQAGVHPAFQTLVGEKTKDD
jgi:DNA-binding MarR family transcriptional regulator